VFVPFKVSRENRVVKGIAIPDCESGFPIISQDQPSLSVNDPTARLLRDGEFDYVLLRLADPEGVAYVSDIPVRRALVTARAVLPFGGLNIAGPAPFNVYPMLTAMDGGGAVITNPALFGIGVNWYLAITFFYDEGR
jgi:hypothetical protein